MERRGLKVADLVRLLGERKRDTSEMYLRHILRRRKRPSLEFADDLAALFDGEITSEAILRAGPRPQSSSDAAA